MVIDTTVSLNINTIEILKNLSNSSGVSKSKIVSIIVGILSSNTCFYRSRILTEYQSFYGDDFFRLHVYLSEADFQIVFDLRRFYRASFSLLITEAITKYYKELLKLLKEPDNYLCTCHVQIYQTIKNGRSWKHYWGMPPKEEIPLE